jgi:hypothetical protein
MKWTLVLSVVVVLAAAVAARNLGCTDYEASTSSITIGNLPKGDGGSCTIDGERSTLRVYKTATDLKTIVKAVPTVGCSFAKGTGTTTLRYVVGRNWTISTPSSATGPKLAKVLGAKSVVHNCSK